MQSDGGQSVTRTCYCDTDECNNKPETYIRHFSEWLQSVMEANNPDHADDVESESNLDLTFNKFLVFCVCFVVFRTILWLQSGQEAYKSV